MSDGDQGAPQDATVERRQLVVWNVLLPSGISGMRMDGLPARMLVGRRPSAGTVNDG
jgi:hypothetical protein